MKIAVHQPQFMPWLGYFDKMAKVDLFILLDTVQFKKNEFQNRNKIKTSSGWQWLTVPVCFRFGDKINEVKINNTLNWKKKHLHSIKTNYGKAPFFGELCPLLEDLYSSEYKLLSDLNYDTIKLIKNLFQINSKIILASSLPALREEATDRLIDICKIFNADTYLAGAGGKNYMKYQKFEKEGIKLQFQNYIHHDYHQLFESFEPYMSSLDYLFNYGH